MFNIANGASGVKKTLEEKMYENEIIEMVNGRVNNELKQWYDVKVKEIALLLIDKLESQNIQIRRWELEEDIQNLALQISEEVLSK